MEEDRLFDLYAALILQRANAAAGPAGEIECEMTPTLTAGIFDLEARLPDRDESTEAKALYGIAFENGWLEARRRLDIVLGFPEARGREATAARLALEPALTFDEVAARLRAAATMPAAVVTGNVVPFQRPIR